MKKLFIYYSFSGNGDVVAEYLSKKVDVYKVVPKKPLSNNKFLGILAGGFKALINYKDELDNFDIDTKYDEIIIGSPIWNSRISSPINTVLDKTNLSGKKLTFILYSGSGTSKGATKRINKLYPSAKIINLKEPLKNKKELKKIVYLLK
ncbi:MAG: hypothetical protein IJI43_01195 [Bacilli bacterium]|nr:hypothetical protein [Bacilli bacterium]